MYKQIYELRKILQRTLVMSDMSRRQQSVVLGRQVVQ